MFQIIGYVAAILTTVAFVPQAYKTWKTRSAKDISLVMFILFTLGVFLWIVYGLSIQSLPIIIANIVTLSLASFILFYKLRYK